VSIEWKINFTLCILYYLSNISLNSTLSPAMFPIPQRAWSKSSTFACAKYYKKNPIPPESITCIVYKLFPDAILVRAHKISSLQPSLY